MAACWAGFTSPVAMSVCLWCMCFCVAEVFFSCSHTVLPKEHSLGEIFLALESELREQEERVQEHKRERTRTQGKARQVYLYSTFHTHW